jgi:sortase A
MRGPVPLAGPSRLCDDRGVSALADRTAGAVRLIDEDEHRTIVLQLVPARQRAYPRFRRDARPRARRSVRALSILLIAAGVLALADAVTTLVWQEPFSAIYASIRQDHLRGALAREEHAPVSAVDRHALVQLPDTTRRIAYAAGRFERRAGDGSAVGRIVIPRIGASFVVVKGTSTSDLESGPGIYPETTFPGIAGTTAIAGHRTTYLAPFRHIDALRPGNHVLLRMPYARFTYTVTGSRVVPPSDVQAAIARVGYSRLVLSACTPLYSADKRILVFARLTSEEPLGALSTITTSARTPRALPRHRRS